MGIGMMMMSKNGEVEYTQIRLKKENVRFIKMVKAANDDFSDYDDVLEHFIDVHNKNCKKWKKDVVRMVVRDG